jgi:DNA primase
VEATSPVRGIDLASPDREALTRRIRQSVDIVDVIGGYVALRPGGANLKGLCPFHKEKTPSFTVHPGKQIFKCFGCGAGGDVFNFIQLYEKVDFLEARQILADRAGISLEGERGGGPGGAKGGDGGGFGKAEIARANAWAAKVFRQAYLGPAGAAARAYVAKRQMSEATAEGFGVGLAVDSYSGILEAARRNGVPEPLLEAAGLARPSQRGDGVYDTFRNRLMFPIVDVMDRVIGFGGRTLGEDPAKYLNTPENVLFEKGRNVFGLNRAKEAIREAGRVIVVEGYTDCLMAHQHGFAETVATLGTAFTAEQAGLLRRYADVAILVFDSDEAGQRAADRALSVSLTQHLEVRLARVPSGKDPCAYLASWGRESFAGLLIEATPALEFKWRQLEAAFEASEHAPARRRAIEAFLGDVAAWVNAGAIDPIARGLILNRIGKLLSLRPEDVDAQLRAAQRRMPRATGVQAGGRPAQRREDEARRERALDRALRQIVEVLLNEPGLVKAAGDALGRVRPTDPTMARIAADVAAWCRGGCATGSWRLDELLGGFGDPEMSRVVTDLQQAGEDRGNYAATLDAALACVGMHEGLGAAGSRSADGAGDEEAALAALAERARSHRHFSPLSAFRRPV